MPTSPEFDALVAQVAATDNVIDSAVTAFKDLAAKIEVAAGDRAASLQLASDLKSKADALAAAIPANTSAANG